MKILYAIFEAAPFAKSGGLGDVGGALPVFLKENGHDVRVIMPKHDAIPSRFKSEMKLLFSFYVQLGWRMQYCGVEMLKYRGVTYYFIDNEQYFKRDSLYGYGDDEERVAFFCKAALLCLTHLERFKPQIIHCNDWHTSLIPLMLKEYFGSHPYYYDIKSVISIHNLKYQGITGYDFLGNVLDMADHVAAREYLAWGGAVNFLKGALHYADAITTVSPSYAREIMTPYFGEGLDGVLRWREERLSGILNGIDYSEYDPAIDKRIFRTYKGCDCEGKAFNKKALQEELALPTEADTPLFVIISRLTEQKGLDLVAHIMEELLYAGDVQVAVLGTGDWRYEEMFYYFANRYPGRIAVRVTFDETLAHKMYAGGDALLMPSKFEPCGITQLIAMKYGTLPIVRETGGLRDTVIPYNKFTGEGTGFSFANYNAHELLFTVREAAKLYRDDRVAWRAICKNACSADFGWQVSADKYTALYDSICKKQGHSRKV
ncbi:MAG: glycogen synthase GlgA [Clostridiales Family XIII bacterium]|jgi:starch synthase|nr:glycogen synthase GlgA [Clostridiales Family XIII bacterium]